MKSATRESLLRQMADSQARDQKDKEADERKRSALVLIVHFLLEQGFLDSAQRLQIESNVPVSKFAVADNIDLLTIITQFAEFHEFKFGKRPKFYKKCDREGGGSGAVTARPGQKHVTPKGRSRPIQEKVPVASASSQEEPSPDQVFVQGIALGTLVPGKAEGAPSHYERLLKPITFPTDDQRELAALISKDIYQENPNVHWQADDIAELTPAKTLLKEAIVLPILFPEMFTGLLAPWKGILLHGPPGVGKTLLARAVATECKTTFFNVSVSSIISKWRGDSEKLVRMLFELARHHAPSTIFIDEIDSIMSSRSAQSEHEASRRMKTELLIQMDGLATSSSLVFVLAASNVPWDLDVAMLRRLEKRILVPLPNHKARATIISKHLEGRAGQLDVHDIAKKTEGFSGADVTALCKEAAMRPLRRMLASLDVTRDLPCTPVPLVTDDDVNAALQSIRPTSDPKLAAAYDQWQRQHGSSISG
ncbi:Katanin p60 ATPase-containing subunit A-like 2 [Plasmodiophora brassicae]